MKFLFEKISKSFDVSAPATQTAIDLMEKHFNVKFPSDYKDFLLFSNGFEGYTKNGYIVIWGAEEMVQLNEDYHVKEFVSNIVIFGSDGAEDAFAFDTLENKFTIVRLPFIGMGHISNENMCGTFEEFLVSKADLKGGLLKRFFGLKKSGG